MSTRMIIAFLVITIAASLTLLVANSIPASTIPLAKPTSEVRNVQTNPARIPTDMGPSNLSPLVPTPSFETAGQDGPSILQDRCTQCHPLQRVQQVKRTRVEWEKVLTKMERLNVKISDTEKSILLDYLTSASEP